MDFLIRNLSKSLKKALVTPASQVFDILEDIKTKVSDEDKERLNWCIEQLKSGSFSAPQPRIPELTAIQISQETVDIIEGHSQLPSLRLAMSDEKSSKESLEYRSRSALSSDIGTGLNIEIDLPEADFDIQDFDLPIFGLAEKYGENILLSIYAFKAFSQWDIFTSLGMNIQVFLRFVSAVADGYKPNAYHNVLHAADVMQACHVFLSSSGLYQLSEMNQMHSSSLLLAALIHDYKHPGLNNSYLMLTGHKIAFRYNDQSILENYHVSKAFQLTQNESLNIFQSLSKEEYRTIRKLMISAVLATDMSKHSIHVGEVQTKLYKNKDLRTEKGFILECFLHLADLSNPCRNFEISKNWAARVSEEFFLQGDKERENGSEISPLCDRFSVNIAKSQIGFISGVIIPFITPICREVKGLRFLINNSKANREKWTSLIDEYQEKINKRE
jgi:hypothetical protein